MKFTSIVTALMVTISLAGCICIKTTKVLSDVNIVPRSAWEALEPKDYAQHKPIRITVHHEGTILKASDDAAKKIKAIQRWGMGPEKKWADIPYHFLIAPDGKVYEGRSVFTVGETSTEYDPTGHLLICCLGNLEKDSVPPAQLKALVQMIAYSSAKYNIPLDSLATHKDFSAQTTCPGKYLSHYFENGYIRRKVKKMK
jgi:hypothetical protein